MIAHVYARQNHYFHFAWVLSFLERPPRRSPNRSQPNFVACLSSQVKCNFYELFIVHFNYGEFENFLCLEVSQITSKIWGYSPLISGRVQKLTTLGGS